MRARCGEVLNFAYGNLNYIFYSLILMEEGFPDCNEVGMG